MSNEKSVQVVTSVHTVLCTSCMVIFLSLHVQEMLMCEYVITYHNVSFITVWCDVVYVFMCTRKRERIPCMLCLL